MRCSGEPEEQLPEDLLDQLSVFMAGLLKDVSAGTEMRVKLRDVPFGETLLKTVEEKGKELEDCHHRLKAFQKTGLDNRANLDEAALHAAMESVVQQAKDFKTLVKTGHAMVNNHSAKAVTRKRKAEEAEG